MDSVRRVLEQRGLDSLAGVRRSSGLDCLTRQSSGLLRQSSGLDCLMCAMFGPAGRP